jgi:hypothetical protein
VNVELEIEELILYCSDPKHRQRLAATVQRKFQRLIERPELASSLLNAADIASLDNGSNSTAAELGARIRVAICEEMPNG